MSAIKIACDQLGGQSSIAAKIGVTRSAVNQWIKGVRPVPVARCPAIERATEGIVRCETLRPDVDWSYLRGTPTHQPQEAA